MAGICGTRPPLVLRYPRQQAGHQAVSRFAILNMPVMDGGAFIQRCRAMPGLDQVPITVMSAAERDSLDGLTAEQVNA